MAYSFDEISKILKEHQLWICDKGGCRANLSNVIDAELYMKNTTQRTHLII